MTANHDLHRRLADFYATQPPLRAPDWVLHAALATIDVTPQRRGPFASRRFQDVSAVGKLAAAVATLLIGGGALWQLTATMGPGASISPTAGPTPARSAPPSSRPSPTPVPSPVSGRAAEFIKPFDYVLPGSPTFDFGTTNRTYFEVRVPEWAEAGHGGGLIVQAIGGGHQDPCDHASSAVALDGGPESVVDYLETVPGMTLTGRTPATVDGQPAVSAIVIAAGQDTGCAETWAWLEDTEPFITTTTTKSIGGGLLRVIAFEVDGEPMVVTVFGQVTNPGLAALADSIIATLRFDPIAPSTTN